MAFDGTLSAGGPGNFRSPNLATEHDGVEVDFITVDYINAMNSEVTFPLASYMVRRDSLDTISSTTTVAAIQAAVRALNSNSKITATISSATAADRDMGDTSVGA